MSVAVMGGRPYDPTTGRFLTNDPIPGGSLNNYDYAGQDPINNYDLNGTCLTGLCWVSHAAKAVGHGIVSGIHFAFHETEILAYVPYWLVCSKLHVPYTEGLINFDRVWDRAAGRSDRDEGRKIHFIERIPGIGYVGPTTRGRGVDKHGTVQSCN